MSDELKARLRSGVIGSDNGARLEHEAATEIERLEAEVERPRVPPAVRIAARVVAERIKRGEGTHDIPNTVLTVAWWCLGELDIEENNDE